MTRRKIVLLSFFILALLFLLLNIPYNTGDLSYLDQPIQLINRNTKKPTAIIIVQYQDNIYMATRYSAIDFELSNLTFTTPVPLPEYELALERGTILFERNSALARLLH